MCKNQEKRKKKDNVKIQKGNQINRLKCKQNKGKKSDVVETETQMLTEKWRRQCFQNI